MKRIVRIAEVVSDKGSGLIGAWLIVILMLLILVEVVPRFFFAMGLSIADEIGGYIFVAITIMGLAYTWKEKGHVRIEVLTSRLPPKVRNWLRLITLILATVFAVVLIETAWEQLALSIHHGARRVSWLATPYYGPQSVIVIGYVLLLLQLIAEVIKAVATVRTPGGKTG